MSQPARYSVLPFRATDQGRGLGDAGHNAARNRWLVGFDERGPFASQGGIRCAKCSCGHAARGRQAGGPAEFNE